MYIYYSCTRKQAGSLPSPSVNSTLRLSVPARMLALLSFLVMLRLVCADMTASTSPSPNHAATLGCISPTNSWPVTYQIPSANNLGTILNCAVSTITFHRSTGLRDLVLLQGLVRKNSASSEERLIEKWLSPTPRP